MKHYQVPAVTRPMPGATNRESGTFPDVADAVVWVGAPHADGTYLIAVPDDSTVTDDGTRTREILDGALDAEAARRQQGATDVRYWYVRSRALRDDEVDPAAPPPRVRETETEIDPTDPTRTR